jgi:ribose transport system permease protein
VSDKKPQLLDFMPVVIFVFVVLIFGFLTNGKLFTIRNIINIANQSYTTILAGFGMIFVIAMGGTDISYGSMIALSGTLFSMASMQFSGLVVFPIAIAVGIASGLIIGVVNTKYHVPSFMASLAMLIALRAVVNLILGANVLQMDKVTKNLLNSNLFKLGVFLLFLSGAYYLFNYTRFGLYVKAIGENENSVKFSGINVVRIKILAFIISGVMASIAGVFIVARTGGVSNTLGASFEMRVMMAIFIGSVPVQGGMKSKIYKLIIGALMITILESGLVLCGIGGSITQGVRGLVLLGSVLLTNILSTRLVFRYKGMRISRHEN